MTLAFLMIKTKVLQKVKKCFTFSYDLVLRPVKMHMNHCTRVHTYLGFYESQH